MEAGSYFFDNRRATGDCGGAVVVMVGRRHIMLDHILGQAFADAIEIERCHTFEIFANDCLIALELAP